METEQKKDPGLKIVREWIKKGAKPQWQEVSRYGQSLKGYWKQWDSLYIRDDLITRKWESTDGTAMIYQTIVPRTSIEKVLRGYFGVNRTLARVRDQYYWFNCRKDIEEWCKRCDQCASKKVFKEGDAVWVYQPKRKKRINAATAMGRTLPNSEENQWLSVPDPANTKDEGEGGPCGKVESLRRQ